MSVPRAQAHLEALGGLTCTLMTLSSSSSEPSLREALDSLLEVWSSMAVDLQMREEEPAMLQALAPYTAKIFRAYIEKSLRDAVRDVEEFKLLGEFVASGAYKLRQFAEHKQLQLKKKGG